MRALIAIAVLAMLPHAVSAATPLKHFPAGASTPAGANPPFSGAVEAGKTLYVAGTSDGIDPATGKPPADAAAAARVVMDEVKEKVERAGYVTDDLVWVEVFASDLKSYADFNAVYRTYFKGPMPARTFVGAGALLGNAHFEVTAIAVKAR